MDEFITLDTICLPTGPFQVGIERYDLEDVYRKDLIFPKGRLIPIQVYFPIGQGLHTIHSKCHEERAALGSFKPLEIKVYSQKSDLSCLVGDRHPVIIINHASNVAMTDYAFLAEDLSSHGYVVISIQHNLKIDKEEPLFSEGRSCSKHAKVIDNILFVFEWLKTKHSSLFKEKIDLKKVGFIGHSLGGNSLLLWLNQMQNAFQQNRCQPLLSRDDQKDAKECFVLLDTTRFSYPLNKCYPLFFLFAEEREKYSIQMDHQVRYYKGSTHISFMDHGYINPPNALHEPYFNGTLKERQVFFDIIRKDIQEFFQKHLQ